LYKKINIAHLVLDMGVGGIQNGIVNLVNGLEQENYYHLICSLTNEKSLESRIKTSNYSLVTFDKKSGNDFTIPFKLMHKFKKHKISLLHLRGWPTLVEGIIGAKLAKVKKILYGFHGKSYSELTRHSKRRLIAEKLSMKYVDGIITLAAPMRDDLCGHLGIDPIKIKVINNGVNIKQFNQETNRQKMRSELNISDDSFVIGSVGRIDPVKDFSTLIKAFALFAKINANSNLVIVGDGPDLNKLKEMVSKTGVPEKIIFAGYQNKIHRFLKIMDVYAQTSLYEGFSNTIIEAMAVGLPVIATEVGGNSVILTEGENGFLVECKHADLIFDRLTRLKNDPFLFQTISKNNSELVEKTFSLDKMLGEYDQYYKNIVSCLELG